MSGVVQAVRGLVSLVARAFCSLGSRYSAVWVLPLMALALGLTPQSAKAQSFTLTPDTSGYVSSSNSGGSWTNTSFTTSPYSASAASQLIQFVGWAVFQIPSGTSYSAVDLSFRAYNYNGGSVTVKVSGIDGVNLSASNAGSLVRVGTSYGSRTISSAAYATVPGRVTLNAAGVQRMNQIAQAGGGQFSIGIFVDASAAHDIEFSSVALDTGPATATVTTLAPSTGSTAGGTSVTVTGTGFNDATSVTVGGASASFYVQSPTRISLTTPARPAGPAEVVVVNSAGSSAPTGGSAYTYVAPVAAPAITSVSPSVGSTAGGTSVTLTGTSFSGATAVTFGATAATGFTVNSATQITATAPAGSGTIDVRVTTPGGTSAISAADRYTYVAAPTVSSVSPSAGPSAGGTAVTITGTNFSGATAVTFGATAATGFTVNSATQITATAPAGTGTVDVRVTTAGGTSATSAADQYTYVARPAVASVSPSVGSTGGGTSVILTGTGFSGTTAVTFGATAATGFTVNSATQITATAPAGSGTVDIRVTTAGGTSLTSAADQYTYVAAPTITSVGPTFGPAVGGTAVAITGTGFTGTTAVTFGATPATGFTVNSATQITATAPAGTGTVDVRVTTAGGTSATSAADQYTFVPAPTLSSVSPAEGAAHASTPPAGIVITGANFSPSGNTVTIGGSPASVLGESATGIQVAPPARATGGSVDLVVTTASGQSVTLANGYRYLLPPTATVTWSPDVIAGVQTTRFSVTVTNPNDVAIQGVRVASNGANTPFSLTAFGTFCGGAGNYNASSGFNLSNLNLAAGASCTATSDQTTSVAGAFQFVTSAPTSTGTATTTVTLTGVPATSNTITVYKTPAISAITPNFGPLAGGTSVTITGTNFNGATAVTIDGVAATNVTVVSTTSITATIPAGVSAGSKTVAVTNPAGTGSRTAFYGYVAPPAVPVILSPVDGSTSLARPIYSGTGVVGSTVTVYVDGVSIGTTVPSGSGGPWSLQQPSALADGSTHTVHAIASTLNGGASAASATINFTVDAVAPAVPVVTTPADGARINTANPGLSGTVEAGSTVHIYVDGALIGTLPGSATTGGTWSYASPTLADGPHTVRASASDPAGNLSPDSATNTFTVDRIPPAAPTIAAPVNGSATADNTPMISGAAEAGSIVAVTIDGAVAGTATTDGSGTWTFTTAALADGSHTVSATAADAVGNLSPASATINFTVDVTAPATPTITAPATGSTTADNTPAISGTSEAGATVTVSIDGAAAGTATANGSGVWTFGSTTLADGPHTVRATATDAVGNLSQVSTISSFTVDATAPVAPTITVPVDGSATADNTPTISGTAEADATVTVSIDGAAAGTATANGSGDWTFTSSILADGAHSASATATDSVGNLSPASTTTAFTVDASAPAAPVIDTPTDGSVTDDGTPVISGTAEDGSIVQLTLNGAAPVSVTATGGTWSYTPTSVLPAGQNTLSAVAVDSVGNASPASVTVRFTYSPVTITTPTLPSGQVGVIYAATIQVGGGTGPYGFTLTGGALPAGVNLSGSGVLSGTPTASGSYPLTVTATDANGLSTSQAYIIAVAQPADPVVTDVEDVVVTVTPASAGDPTVIDLSGAVQNAVRIEIVTPPAHGVATVNGFEVTYTPDAGYFGRDSFTYRAVGFDDGGAAAPAKDGSPSSGVSQPAMVSIVIASPTLSLTGGTQASGQIGAVYSQTLTTSGGTAPYSYAVTGGALPAGITLATDGTLSGSPTAGGPFSFTVTATDSSTGTGPFSISVVHDVTIDAPALTVTPPVLPNATTAQAYSQNFSTTGGVAPYSYAVTAGALPTGLTLSPAGVLSGTPTQGGAFTFTVAATDASTGAGPYTASQPVTLTVAASAIAVTPANLTSGTRGTPYAATVAAAGGVAPYTYTIASGALPAGLTLSTTGQISGTPTVVGTFAFQVRATDSATGAGPYSGTTNVTLTIASATLTVTPTTLPDGLAGVSWSQQLQASGGQGGYSFAVTAGVLPTGLTLTPAGLLSGKPTTAGTFAFTVTATDGFGNTGFAALSVTVIGRPDPSADPDVRGLNSAQAEAARRMVGTQLGNFGRRLEQLHRGGGNQAGAAMNLTLDGSAFTPLDEGRASMGELATAMDREAPGGRDLSGREELNRMVWGDRVGADASGGRSPAGRLQDGLNTGEGGPGSGGPGSNESSGPRVWAGGAISLGERDATTRTAEMSITTSGISVGVDLGLADNLDLGVGIGFGQENTDVGSEGSRMEADSRLAVAYGSWRPTADVFIDGILGYGELGFDMHRRTPVDQSLVFGQRDGTALFGSLSAGLDRVAGPARWLGYGRVEVLNADLDAYAETGSPFWALSYEARSVESLQGALGLRYEQEVLRGHDLWVPGVRVEWTHEFGDSGLQGLRYADWLDGPGYAIGQEGWERSRFNLGLSLGWRARDGWSWTGEYNGAFSNGEAMNGLRIKGSKAF